MTVELATMTEAEAQAFTERSIIDYATAKVRAGAWTQEEALTKSREAFERRLPNGVYTEHHYLYTIHAEGQAVGSIWVAKEKNFGKPVVFIYDVIIYDEFRRKGYASTAFELLEDLVKSWGLDTIALHVFGDNTGALELYKKLGYEITDISMVKSLS